MEMSSTFPKMIRLLVNERTLLLISSRTSHDHAWSLHGQACQRRPLQYEGLHLFKVERTARTAFCRTRAQNVPRWTSCGEKSTSRTSFWFTSISDKYTIGHREDHPPSRTIKKCQHVRTSPKISYQLLLVYDGFATQ
jgi:hypothetical protein